MSTAFRHILFVDLDGRLDVIGARVGEFNDWLVL
jgi:hypothetical protein